MRGEEGMTPLFAAAFVPSSLTASSPYVTPLDPVPALSILHAWEGGNRKLSKERSARVARMCDFVSGSRGGSVGLVGAGGYVVAIANVAHSPLTVVDVYTSPYEQSFHGTDLIRALLREEPSLLFNPKSLDERWVIAFCLLRRVD